MTRRTMIDAYSRFVSGEIRDLDKDGPRLRLFLRVTAPPQRTYVRGRPRERTRRLGELR